jgi:2-polyprenyl-6-methoxyphenol hydroxylase-like FAD-dependent oxidoreductase
MRVVIVGGGIGGLTSALIFKRMGCSVKLFETSVSIHQQQLYTGLWNPSFHILNQLGIFSELQRHVQPIHRLSFRDMAGDLLVQSKELRSPPGILPTYSL